MGKIINLLKKNDAVNRFYISYESNGCLYHLNRLIIPIKIIPPKSPRRSAESAKTQAP